MLYTVVNKKRPFPLLTPFAHPFQRWISLHLVICIDSVTGVCCVAECTQLEDPRLEWRAIQEAMLRDYLHTAQDVLEVCTFYIALPRALLPNCLEEVVVVVVEVDTRGYSKDGPLSPTRPCGESRFKRRHWENKMLDVKFFWTIVHKSSYRREYL